MTSPKQRRVKEANVRKTTGPRTRSGKEKSRLNAYRHGLAAAQVVEPTEIQDLRIGSAAVILTTSRPLSPSLSACSFSAECDGHA
jgi:hypothetical protein